MGVLNIPQIQPANPGNSNAAMSVVSPLLEMFLKKKSAEKTKVDTEKARMGLEELLNKNRTLAGITEPTPENVSNYQAAIEGVRAANQGERPTEGQLDVINSTKELATPRNPDWSAAPERNTIPRGVLESGDISKIASERYTAPTTLAGMFGREHLEGKITAEKAAESLGTGNTLSTDENGNIVVVNKNKPTQAAIPVPGAHKPASYVTADALDPNNPDLVVRGVRSRSDPTATVTGTFGTMPSATAAAKSRAESMAGNRLYASVTKPGGTPEWVSQAEIKERRAKGESTTPAAYDSKTKQSLAEAGQAGGTRAASVRTASNVFNAEMPEIIEIRNRVAENGLLPTGGFKDVEVFNQWLNAKTNDEDTVILKKKVKLLADTLQRTVGGSQGGQWAFEVAADILDGTYSPRVFQKILESHGKTLKRMADEYANFGQKESAAQDMSKMSDEELQRIVGGE